ncbi:MAG: hypothetical protein ACOXZQ_00790 [Bacteroidales bacterium]|jgi:uncharacterized protein (TIGR02145 family)|nr:hypothetical protein [Bacteroidales bacterium]HPA69114.1 hypothetical protein [Bacteroidales bacterium]HQN58464.1 hypothetical protein [Bacteroidales bacterium]HQO84867.1 hypothetical protein [Bacteroidales bacterium]
MKAKNILLFLLAAALMASCEREDMTSPVALFSAQTPPIYKFKVNLDASGSFPTEDVDWLEYRWDINGDHLGWETDWSGNPIVTIEFPFAISGYIGLQVRNSDGRITELYQGFITDLNYEIFRPHTNLEIGFSVITYRFYHPGHLWAWMWSCENIQLPDSDGWYNYTAAADRFAYGSLMPWSVADTLEKNYHLPSKADWQEMINYCGGAALAGFNLQVEAEHGLQLTLPGIVTEGLLREQNSAGYYWTGDEVDEESAWALKISADSDEAKFVILDKSSLASVRLMNILNYR